MNLQLALANARTEEDVKDAYIKALPILEDASNAWPKSGSAADKVLAAQVAAHIEMHYVVYDIASHEQEFIGAVKSAVQEDRIIRTPITPDNLRQVFDKWTAMIGSELGAVAPADYAVLFFADIMHDGANAAITHQPARLLYDSGKPVFLLNGQTYELASERGYRNFWAIYYRPLEAYGDTELTDFDPFKAAYTALGAKLRPLVFELGFLPE